MIIMNVMISKAGGGYPIIGLNYWKEKSELLSRKLKDKTFLSELNNMPVIPKWLKPTQLNYWLIVH